MPSCVLDGFMNELLIIISPRRLSASVLDESRVVTYPVEDMHSTLEGEGCNSVLEGSIDASGLSLNGMARDEIRDMDGNHRIWLRLGVEVLYGFRCYRRGFKYAHCERIRL